MQIKIKTLTPIWTGDINRKCSKLRETSIIGSLRWWFETIVRGFGGHACDPTSKNRCELKGEELKKGKKPEDLICPVCYVFGTTGWSRRFRLEIDGKSNQAPFVIIKVNERKEHRGWFLGSEDSGGILGEFTIKICEIHDKFVDLIALLLHVSSSWGIGTKTQDGFGICKFEGKYNIDKAISQIKSLIKANSERGVLPSLEDFFFCEIKIEENDIKNKIEEALNGKLYKKVQKVDIIDYLNAIPNSYKGKFYPTAPLIRSWLRGLFRNNNDDLRHFLFGFVSVRGDPTPMCKTHLLHTIKVIENKNYKYRCLRCDKVLNKDQYFEKMGSKIFVSHIYYFDNAWRFKIWGYIPKRLPNRDNRREILEKLYKEIVENKGFCDVLDLNKDITDIKWRDIFKVKNVEALLKEIIKW